MYVNPLQDAALEYAARGWQVFPAHNIVNGRCSCGNPECASSGKHPRTEHGLHDATTDPEIIAGWWQQRPEANIGIRTGAESGIFVLDIDSLEAIEALQAAGREIPDGALGQRTGRGRQVVFRHPGWKVKNSTKKLGADLDIRGDGGYIIAPPSMHLTGRRYTWETEGEPREAPPWLLIWLLGCLLESVQAEAKATRVAVPQTAPTIDTSDPRVQAYVTAAIEDEYKLVQEARETTRNDTLFLAAVKLGTLAHLGAARDHCEAGLVWAAKAAGLPEIEARKTFASGWDYGLGNPRQMPPEPEIAGANGLHLGRRRKRVMAWT